MPSGSGRGLHAASARTPEAQARRPLSRTWAEPAASLQGVAAIPDDEFDEFDELGKRWVPQGAHRKPRPRWRVLLPYLIALLLAPVLAYLGVTYLTGLGDGGDGAAETVVTGELSAP